MMMKRSKQLDLVFLRLWLLLCFLFAIRKCNSYSVQKSRQQQQQLHWRCSGLSSTDNRCHIYRCGRLMTMVKNHEDMNGLVSSRITKHAKDASRRYVLSLVGSAAALAVTTSSTLSHDANAVEVVPNASTESAIVTGENKSENESLTTQLFNPDGSLKDAEQVVEAQERTVTLPIDASVELSQTMIWMDGIPSSSNNRGANDDGKKNDGASTTILQYNLPMKWDSNYIDSTTKERACTRVSTYRMPYQRISNSDKVVTKGKRQSTSSNNVNSLQVSDIVSALPQDSIARQSLLGADIVGGSVRRTIGSTGSRTKSTTSSDTTPQDDVYDATTTAAPTKRSYSEFDLAVAPTTCSGGENEDLRLGFCPYDRIFLVSATTTPTTTENDGNSGGQRSPEYISILIVESTRSEWQRANADLRRLRSSFVAS